MYRLLSALAVCSVFMLIGSPTLADDVTQLILVNADSDQDIGPLIDGTTLDLDIYPTSNLNVRATTSPDPAGSVVFDLNGVAAFQIETTPPYAMAGDSNGNFHGWTPAPGPLTITATAYTGAGGTGTPGTPYTVNLTVVGTGGGFGNSFGLSIVSGTSLNNPTALQFGPDDRLYVGQQNGKLVAMTIVRNAANDYSVTAAEAIYLIQNIPNHNDDGSLAPGVNTRQVTGMVVTGTAQSPVLYVASSDSRIVVSNTNPPSQSLDTNSGMVSRLTWNSTSGQWEKLDIVRGLPRSEENHASNGMALDESTNTLYLMQGGHTNMGAPGTKFSGLPEYALSGACLSIDLDAIGETTYDLPTLAGTAEPFGGNDGANQAMLVTGGPVQVYMAGFRNPYDMVRTQAGLMYSCDNGPNSSWGGRIINGCNQDFNEGGSATLDDNLHLITQGGYAGHPNPARANPQGIFGNEANSPVPFSMANPIECELRHNQDAVGDGALALFDDSTNGICEYTATNFNGGMQGNLILASWDDSIYRVELNGTGDAVVAVEEMFNPPGNDPLDVTAVGDGHPFGGSIWIANYTSNSLIVAEANAPALPPADPIRGATLYDNWWLAKGVAAPVNTHPLYPPAGSMSGTETNRCVECHGWDYLGAAGEYATGPHFTGVGGVLNTSRTDSELFELIDGAVSPDGHGFGAMGLSAADVNDLVAFLTQLASDPSSLVDPSGDFVGDPVVGETNFLSATSPTCIGCHGGNGQAINVGTLEDPRWIGDTANDEPFKLLHKVQFGNPGTPMPSFLLQGGSTQGAADIGAYVQGFPRGILVSTPPLPAAGTRLFQNVPNPFNPSTLIRFELATAGFTTVTVHDVAGRLVKLLAQAELPAGPHALVWRGDDARNRRVASGTYYYKLESADGAHSRRMVLLK